MTTDFKRWSADGREKLDKGEIKGAFAGKGKRYPIADQADIADAWKLAGQSKDEDPDLIRKRIIQIALKYDWLKGLPDTAVKWADDNAPDLADQLHEKLDLNEPELAETDPYKTGQTVKWNWQNGTATGKVEEVHTKPVTRKIKGTEITRNGSKDNPAYLIKQENDNLALKLHSELTKIDMSQLEFRTRAAGAKPNCSKGYSCGSSCIQKSRLCSNVLAGQGKTYAEYLSKQKPGLQGRKTGGEVTNIAYRFTDQQGNIEMTYTSANGGSRKVEAVSSRFSAMTGINATDSGMLPGMPESIRKQVSGLRSNIDSIAVLRSPNLTPEDADAYARNIAKEGDVVVLSVNRAITGTGNNIKFRPSELADRVTRLDSTAADSDLYSYVGIVRGGKLTPLTNDDQQRMRLGQTVRTLRAQQAEAIGKEFAVQGNQNDLRQVYRDEDRLAAQSAGLDDRWVGRNPKPGVVPNAAEWRRRADDFARQQGFDDNGVNGFTAAQTQAHDIAHPVTHAMLGMNSRQINQTLGNLRSADGKPSLLGEEAIVNVVEHLSRGDSLEASITNGMRVVRALSRNSTPEERAFVRSRGFKEALVEMANNVYRNDNYNEYMFYVRASNRISKTVQQLGDDFTTTAT